MFVPLRSRPWSLTFFPDYRAKNPYQTLLYAAVGATVDSEPGTITQALERQAREPDPKLFHLHWENAALLGGGRADAFLDDLERFRGRGGRIVWSLHNVEPHDHRLRDQVADLWTALPSIVDVLHLHSIPALAAVLQTRSLPMEKVRIIAHGNYDGAYPRLRRVEARSDLKLDTAGMCVLIPGRLAGYKNPGLLVESFLAVAGPEDRLIVAGEPAADVRVAELPVDERVILHPAFASPVEFARYHAAADFIVLPYDRSLTSGSAILAATLGRGVLGADTAGLRDVVEPPRTGMIYDPTDEKGLRTALDAALRDGPDVWRRRGEAANLLAVARNWTTIGAAWSALYRHLAESAAPVRNTEGMPCG
jgi:beta-1,4-mannosyltransferase